MLYCIVLYCILYCIVESLVLVIVRFANSFSPNDVAIACNYEENS